jgi:hypothetical protein
LIADGVRGQMAGRCDHAARERDGAAAAAVDWRQSLGTDVVFLPVIRQRRRRLSGWAAS